jgi:hypothetical protein
MKGSRVALLLRTASHLTAAQVGYRLLRSTQRVLPVRLPRAREADEERLKHIAQVVAAWGPGDVKGRLRSAERILAGEFRFLNHTVQIDEPDWRSRPVNALWSFNLQYFSYAVDLAWAWRLTSRESYVRRLEALVLSWIVRVGDPVRGDSWHPYAISERIGHWLYALVLAEGALLPQVRSAMLLSIYRQAAFLEKRLEKDLEANHLQANYFALFLCGLAYAGPTADRWRETGGRGLWRSLADQVLTDGVHYERSPMYHAIVLRDFLRAVELGRAIGEPLPEGVVDRLWSMVDAAGALSRPRTGIHLFNDSTHGIGPSMEELSHLAVSSVGRSLEHPRGAWSLPEGGYHGFVDPDLGERLIVDCGEPAAPTQPGHAHCDLLSYELDLAGQPVVVDSGVHGYDGDRFREYSRSTRAHNTLEIGEREQHEIWGAFRLARRARVLRMETSWDGESYRFAGAYSPYHDHGAAHHREILGRRGSWTVLDRVRGATGTRLRSFLHLHPHLSVRLVGELAVVEGGGLSVEIRITGADRVRLYRGETNPRLQGWYFPEFGIACPAWAVEITVEVNDGRDFGYTLTYGTR